MCVCMRVHVCVDCLCVCACIRACVHMQALRKKEEADHQEHLASATHASLLGSVRVPAAAAAAGYAPVGHGGGGGAPPGGQQWAYAADVGACADAALRGSVGVGGLVDSYISRFDSEPARAAFVVDVTDKMEELSWGVRSLSELRALQKGLQSAKKRIDTKFRNRRPC